MTRLAGKSRSILTFVAISVLSACNSTVVVHPKHDTLMPESTARRIVASNAGEDWLRTPWFRTSCPWPFQTMTYIPISGITGIKFDYRLEHFTVFADESGGFFSGGTLLGGCATGGSIIIASIKTPEQASEFTDALISLGAQISVSPR